MFRGSANLALTFMDAGALGPLLILFAEFHPLFISIPAFAPIVQKSIAPVTEIGKKATF
jgi:hypothetical protein